MYNILIVGVGGQGSLLASRVLGQLYLAQGQQVKVSEVHGMSQRGGSVVTYVRAGESVASPLIPDGEADLLIALEKLEALRWAHCLRPGGTVVLSTQEILPMPVISGAAVYPGEIEETLRTKGLDVVDIPALELANQAGSPKAANIVLLGAASGRMPFDEGAWAEALQKHIKPKLLELNRRAFLLGREA